MATRAAFAAHRAEIDDVNVFPVPDGDTGTNLYMTFDSALEAAREASPGSDPSAEPTLAGDAAALGHALFHVLEAGEELPIAYFLE